MEVAGSVAVEAERALSEDRDLLIAPASNEDLLIALPEADLQAVRAAYCGILHTLSLPTREEEALANEESQDPFANRYTRLPTIAYHTGCLGN